MLQTHKSLLSMQQSVPSYLIRYIECGVQGHEGEKVNLICLGDKCQETSLICSLCAATSHHGHPYKPLKIYLDELYRNYKGNNSAYERDLADLDRRRDVLLLHLRACVERLAQEFMQLQDDILGTYESIRNQIHQNEARRNKFEQFYLSMIKDNYGDPFFEVKNYLFREELHTLSDQDIFQGIASKLAEQLKIVRANFKGNFRVESKIEQPKEEVNKDAKVAFLRPPCITNVGDLYSQTNLAINSPNFCLFDSQIGDWSAKLRVQVMSLQPGAKLTFGLIRKDDFLKANYLLKEETASMWLDSLGKHKGDQYSHITAISVNHIIDFFVKKQNFRVTCKNNNALFNLTDKKWCFFFALEGNCQIKITYPYNK